MIKVFTTVSTLKKLSVTCLNVGNQRPLQRSAEPVKPIKGMNIAGKE